MTAGEDKAKQWKFRLWQLFALVAAVAITLWVFQHVSFDVRFQKYPNGRRFMHVNLRWDHKVLINWYNDSSRY